MLKFVLINEGEANEKLPKMYGGKNVCRTKEQLHMLI